MMFEGFTKTQTKKTLGKPASKHVFLQNCPLDTWICLFVSWKRWQRFKNFLGSWKPSFSRCFLGSFYGMCLFSIDCQVFFVAELCFLLVVKKPISLYKVGLKTSWKWGEITPVIRVKTLVAH